MPDGEATKRCSTCIRLYMCKKQNSNAQAKISGVVCCGTQHQLFWLIQYEKCVKKKISTVWKIIQQALGDGLCMLSRFSCVRLFATIWTVARQASLSMGISRQEYWSGLPCPSPGDLLNPRIEPASLLSLASAGGIFIVSATWEAHPKERKCRISFLTALHFFRKQFQNCVYDLKFSFSMEHGVIWPEIRLIIIDN